MRRRRRAFPADREAQRKHGDDVDDGCENDPQERPVRRITEPDEHGTDTHCPGVVDV